MAENPRTGRFTCFNLAIVILGLLAIASCGLLIFVGGKAWQIEQQYKNQRDELRQQAELWRSQRIHDYEVTYTNCQGTVCCENARMIVRTTEVIATSPDCTAIPGLQSYELLARVQGMSDLYTWVEEEFQINDGWKRLEIEYHPDLHYITRLVWQRNDWSTVIEIRYEDLKPRDS